MCKAIYLPVDEKRGKAKADALNDLSHHFASASATSYYCVVSGLVRIPKAVCCTRQELALLEHRIFDGAVPPLHLAAIRGRRQEASTAHGVGLDQDPDHIIEANDAYNAGDLPALSVDLTVSFDSDLDPDQGVTPSERSGATDLELGLAGDDRDIRALEEVHLELISAADYLEQSKSIFPDNRCCIKAEDDGGVEVEETTTQRPVNDEEPAGFQSR